MVPRELIALSESGCENFTGERQKLLDMLQPLIRRQSKVGAQCSQIDIGKVAGMRVNRCGQGSGIHRARF